MLTTAMMVSIEDFEKYQEYVQLLERQNALLKEQIARFEKLNEINDDIIEEQSNLIESLKANIRIITDLM